MSTFHELQELRDKRNRIVSEARQILEAAKAAKRELSEDENKNYERAIEDGEKVQAEIEKREKLDQLERAALAEGAKPVETGVETKATTPEDKAKRTQEIRDQILSTYIVSGTLRDLPSELIQEARALQVDVDTSGGYLRPDEQFVARLLKNVDDLVAIRGVATKFSLTNAESIGIPYMSARASNPAWTTELQTGSDDTQLAFGKRSLTPHPLAKRIKVSEKLLRSSALPVESIVRSEMAYVFGLAEESAFMTGSGANQPLGLFTASADGINTDRDVSTGNATTSIQFDGLKEARWTLKSQYQNGARWLFHRDALKQISKLKDGEGRYLWQPSVVAGSPGTIDGLSYFTSDYVPNTFMSGLYVGMLADFSHYWIVDALNFRLQRLNELYAESGQVGFIGRLEADGAPVLPEAFVRVKLA